MFRGNQRAKDDQGLYATDLVEREAIKFIASSGEQPWFLYLCFNAPHGASSFGPDADNPKSRVGVQAPEKYLAMYAGSEVPERLRPYYAAVTCMDAAIGRVLMAVRELGQEQNTFVIFHSDNGGSGNGGNAPLQGSKGSLWEGGLRVPCLARWPAAGISGGRVCEEFLTTLEWLPTLSGAAGLRRTSDVVRDIELDGYDATAVLRGEGASPRKEMFWEFRGQKAARVGNYKWIDSAKAKGLFDLAADPGEKNDLSAAQPQIAADIESRWTAWRKATRPVSRLLGLAEGR
jgi:arylsulfatase A-like enzyme